MEPLTGTVSFGIRRSARQGSCARVLRRHKNQKGLTLKSVSKRGTRTLCQGVLEQQQQLRLLALLLQVESFSQGLKSHQKAVTGDGTTVLEKAVVEHNLAAASRLYNNIYFAELGQLLGVSAAQAESVACRMIAEERLKVGHLHSHHLPLPERSRES